MMVGFLWIVLLSIDLGSLGILAKGHQFYYQEVPIPDSAYRYKNKQKRESSRFYEVEALIILDYSLYLRLSNIISEYLPYLYDVIVAVRNFYMVLIDRVDQRFSQLDDSGFMIRIAVTDTYYADSLANTPWSSTIQQASEISATKALDEMNSWLRAGSHVTVTKNTTVIALTAMKLLDNSSRAVQGISQYGSICNGPNIIILQETFDFILATVATHYIARSMGAHEDGKENNCSADGHFIMSTPNMAITGETKSNPWRFSECSKREIKTFISSLSNVCFTRLTSVTNVPLDTAGTSFTVDQQCKIIKGTSSYMCRVPLGGKYEEMCTGMYCYNATNKMCELVVPTEGTLCGDRKWCINGVCSSSFTAPSAIAECVHGDQPVLEFSTTGCNSYISIAPSECYKGNVSLACCKTCSNYATGTEDCLYGNKIATCSIRQRDCYNGSINRDCCKTCSYYETTFTDCLYGDRIGSCESISARDCYNDTINTNCCNTCRTYNIFYGDCEYGDRAAWCASISGWDCYDENINRNCCSTCKTFISYSPANCEYGDRFAWCKSITSRDCYDAATNSQCCKSCSLYNTYTTNCEYGDRVSGCLLSVGDCYDSSINTDCCKTCQNYRTFALNCEYGNRIASCESVLGLDCYNASINRNCCQTCLSFKTAYSNCLYGDYVFGCRTSECSTYSADKLKQCCGTCRAILPRTSPVTILATVATTDKQPNNQATGSHDTVTAATLSKNASNDGWVGPVVGTIVGLVIFAVGVTSVLCYLRRRQRLKKTKQVQQQQQLKDVTSKIPNMTPSYNSQSNRPPMAPPRDFLESGVSLDGDAEETYTYIYPVDTEDSSGTVANTSVKYGIGYSTNRNDNDYIEPVRPKQCSTSFGYEVTGTSGTGKDYIEPVRSKQYSTSFGNEVTGTSGTGNDYGYLHLETDVNASS